MTLSGMSLHPHNEYSDLLHHFSELLTPRFDSTINKHGVEHHIETHGPPVHARARRLNPEKLRAVKAEFLKMEEMGIMRRSNSPWSSPLHVVPKAEKMEEMGIIRRSNSPWSSPLHVVPKAGKMEEMGIMRRSNSPWSSPLHVVPKAGKMEEMGIMRRSNSPWSSPLHVVPKAGKMEEMGIMRRSYSPWSSPLHVVPKAGKMEEMGIMRRSNSPWSSPLHVVPKAGKMEEMGIMRRSNSPWSSPLHVVPKAGGQWRPCGDYRHLNAATKDDRYPLPHIQDFNNILTGCKIFSKIDLAIGYHQILMASSSVAKTAIITPFGLWEFLRMPFGLKNAAQAFQRLMDGILRDIPFTFVYIDDILVASHSHEEHLEHLRQLFELLSANGLVINKTKCVFGVPELDFLGHRVLH